ncbi:cytochrome b [Paroceanicella profunda]|uniref:Cytochrome b n=1 Tax=Paroceanicella profunda TaxID=2579971 RepID=A0A5B8G172_9RHOB|nr:cytochrome b [Paroceanicella profunda]QDL92193.1 cytochrome b [Paroceanicella profunda]
MSLMNTRTGWGWPARLLHWCIAALIVFMSGLGLYMTNAFPSGSMDSYPWYQLHKSWGFVVFVLLLVRILWRWLNRVTPELPAGMPLWERLAAHGAHWALYALMAAIPLSGWLMVSASPLQDMGVPNKVFGLFSFPDPFQPGDRAIEGFLKEVHETTWYLLLVVLALHVLGALKHHFISRDTVLRRMLRGQ